jgi:hypothetical protein
VDSKVRAKFLTSTFLILALIAASGSAAAATEPMTDGFEDGDLFNPKWDMFGSRAVTTNQSYSGSYSLDLTPWNSSYDYSYVQQDLNWSNLESGDELSVYTSNDRWSQRDMHHGIQLEGPGSNSTIYAHIDNMNGSVQFDVQFYNETGNYMQSKPVCNLYPNSGDFYKIGAVVDGYDYIDFKLYNSSGSQICSYNDHLRAFTPNTYQLSAGSDEPSTDQDTTAYFDTATYSYSSSNSTNDTTESNAPTIKSVDFVDLTDGDGNVTKGDQIEVQLDLYDESNISTAYMDWNAETRYFSNTESNQQIQDRFDLNATSLQNTAQFYVEDEHGNSDYSYIDHNLTYVSSNNGSNDNSTDTSNETEYTIELLRDVPADQSFEYMQGMDSENISIENDTVMVENGSSSGVYVTRKIRSDKFDRVRFNTTGMFVKAEVIDANSVNDTVLRSGQYEGRDKPKTVNISDVNTTSVKLRFELDGDDTVRTFAVYGDVYDGGFFGGGNLITGDFFANIPVVGEGISGVTAGVNNVVSGVLNVPADIFEGVVEVIPFL